MYWCSKLQTEIGLSTVESEYIALSQATREVIPFVNLLKEINQYRKLSIKPSQMKYKLCDDNTRCITIAEGKKFSSESDFVIINYDILKNFHDPKKGDESTVLNAKFDLVIMDEAHMISNPQAQIVQASSAPLKPRC